jgi:hypothetical protein
MDFQNNPYPPGYDQTGDFISPKYNPNKKAGQFENFFSDMFKPKLVKKIK